MEQSEERATPGSAHSESSQDEPQRTPEAGGQNPSDAGATADSDGDTNEKADARARIADPSGRIIDEREEAD